LFDTDIGSDVDDAVALALLLASPEAIALAAVTTVAADTTKRAQIAALLLGLAGRNDVPISIGERDALLRPHRFAIWGHEGLGVGDGPSAPISSEPAPERIVRMAREMPGLHILAVGPMTNVARALALDPELPRRVAGLTIMGGHIRRVAIGRKVFPPGIDYNLCSDPEASVAVLGAGFQTTLVTADVTLQTWLRPADVDAMEKSGPVGRSVAAQIRIWDPVQRKLFTDLGGEMAEDNVGYLHDPLAALALIDPAPLHFEELRIVTTIEQGVLRTIEVDAASGLGAPMRVATRVDAHAAERSIVARITQAGTGSTPRPTPRAGA
jgi:purine nucleosidase